MPWPAAMPSPDPSAGDPSAAPLLSICIPAYNRGPFLPDLFRSILRERDTLPPELGTLGLEVVVSDNGSTDDTADRVRPFGDAVALTYVRQPQNIGPDRNFLAVVAAARGRFCWLMGSDDVLEPGGLAAVLRALDADVAGLSVNYLRRSFDLSETSPVRPPVALAADETVTGAEAIYRTFVGHWGYLSGHVVRRDLWQAVVATGEPEGFLNAYVHVLIMGRMAERLPRWGWVQHRCVGWRGRNDSFLSGDHVDRMMIDVRGYRAITEQIWGRGSATTAAVMDAIAGTHILVHYRIAKVFYHSGRSLRGAAVTLTREYWRYPSYWRRLLPWIVAPAPLLHGAWVGYQRARHRLDPSFKIHPQARRR
jgi:abequosyltransferase